MSALDDLIAFDVLRKGDLKKADPCFMPGETELFPTLVFEDDFRNGTQGWTQLMGDFPSGILTLDSDITANGSGYSLGLATGDYANTSNPFGSCMAIKRMGRSSKFKYVYLKMLFAYGSSQNPPSTAERSPRCIEFGVDQCDDAGARNYFKIRWHNWQYIPTLVTGTCQSGSTSTTIKLATGASTTNDLYKGQWAIITGGAGVLNEKRQITGYVGSTRVATVSSAWTTTPDATTTYTITEGTDGEIVASRVTRFEMYDSQLGVYIPVRGLSNALATHNLGWNENKRNLHAFEMLVDLENIRYLGMRIDGVGYGRMAATPNDLMTSYKPAPSTLVPFGNGLNGTMELRNRTETNTAAAHGNLAYAKMIGLSSLASTSFGQ